VTGSPSASGAEDRLISLTSRDGDWFLDDMYSTTDTVVQYLQLTSLSKVESDEQGEGDSTVRCATRLYEIIAGVHSIYSSLQVSLADTHTVPCYVKR